MSYAMKLRRIMSKPPSVAQLWARERNWNKARIVGTIQQLKSMAYQESTLPKEKSALLHAADIIEDVFLDWNIHNYFSKKKYLKLKGGE